MGEGQRERALPVRGGLHIRALGRPADSAQQHQQADGPHTCALSDSGARCQPGVGSLCCWRCWRCWGSARRCGPRLDAAAAVSRQALQGQGSGSLTTLEPAHLQYPPKTVPRARRLRPALEAKTLVLYPARSYYPTIGQATQARHYPQAGAQPAGSAASLQCNDNDNA